MGSRVCESSSCITLCMSSPMGLPPGACCPIIRIWCSAVISIRPKWSNGSIPTAASANWPRARFTMAVSPTPTATPASSCAWNWIRTCARLRSEVVEWIDPDRRLRELAAGSLYDGGLADTYGNSCQFVRLELDSDLRPIEALVRFRSFSPKGGHWFDDNSLYRESKEGRITWTFGVPAPL